MTDTTPGAGLPDDRLGPETPGPEATAEQEAYVAGLLGSLRADDPEIPDHVAARIDGVLAELRRTEPVLPGAASALGDADDASTTASAAASSTTEATVLPLPSQRRESGTSRTFRWVAGAAAAVVVLAGGAAVIRTALPGGGSSGSSTTASDATSGGGPVPIRSTGTSYSRSELSSQASSLVANAAKGGDQAPEVAPEVDPSTAPTTSGATDPQARQLLSTGTLAACLEQLTGGPGAMPVAIDQGTYEGQPADIVVLPSPDDAARLEVWVIGPGCTRENVQMYEFRTIPAPGASTAPEAPESDAPAPASTESTPAAP